MTTIAVDIDDTLYSFTQLARELMADEAERTGDKQLERASYVPWNQWRTPPDLIGLDKWLEIVNLCHDNRKILSRAPFDNAADVLIELSLDNEIIYVSNRDTERYDATYEWLMQNDFPSGELVCASHFDKQKYLGKAQYLIDDRPKNLIEFVYDYNWKNKHGSQAKQRVGFGLMTEFNDQLTDVPNIYLAPPRNWRLLRRFFVKSGLLEKKELTHA